MPAPFHLYPFPQLPKLLVSKKGNPVNCEDVFSEKIVTMELLNKGVGKVKDPSIAAEDDPNTTGYLRGKAWMRILWPYAAESPCLLSTSSPWQAAGKLKDATGGGNRTEGIFSSPIKAVCRVH